MVEGSQIDWACHGNNEKDTIRKVLLFDMAVRKALDFALMNKVTLVLVVADHETGGMAITDGSLDGQSLKIKWTTGGHSAVPVPIFAFGPHAEIFTGVQDNTEIASKLFNLLK